MRPELAEPSTQARYAHAKARRDLRLGQRHMIDVHGQGRERRRVTACTAASPRAPVDARSTPRRRVRAPATWRERVACCRAASARDRDLGPRRARPAPGSAPRDAGLALVVAARSTAWPFDDFFLAPARPSHAPAPDEAAGGFVGGSTLLDPLEQRRVLRDAVRFIARTRTRRASLAVPPAPARAHSSRRPRHYRQRSGTPVEAS